VLLLLSTSDTDLMSARAANGALGLDEPDQQGLAWRYANPSRLAIEDLDDLLDGADLVVVRLLGGRQAWAEGLDRLLASGRPVVVLTGEQAPDAHLMGLSTVPAGVAAQAHAYLAHGGPANLGQLARFLSDTVLLTGEGFEAPAAAPAWGRLERGSHVERPQAPLRGATSATSAPKVAVLYYRAHQMSGNTTFVEGLCDAIEAKGGTPLPIWCASLRDADDTLLEALGEADAIVTTVLAAGGTTPARAQAGGEEESWDAGALADLDRPILQGLCLTSTRQAWEENDEGVSPFDAATQVAVPEFDGRLITVPFSFKEFDAEGLPTYVADPERALRVAGLAVSHARLRYVDPTEHRVALVLSAYPTKHARIGNAVGLDTGASAVALLRRLADEGWVGASDLPGVESGRGDDLIHALIAAGGYDENWLTQGQLDANTNRIPGETYRQWFARMPEGLRDEMTEAWGEAPGSLFVDDGDLVLAAIQSGNVVVLVQPPRGFGENPIAIYHDPDLAPSHHYLAAYRWLEAPQAEGGWGADAVIHLGKHGNLEWLPGKNAGLSADCAPDAVLGDLPLIYPFLVNDPGEGTQAKRRAHATLVDHLVPPMARAESYGDIARLEQLLDEYGNVATMDPAKLPSLRAKIWTLLQAAKMDRELGLIDKPDDERFDDMIMEIDGWLCEIKDSQIRDGLHVLGQAPAGDPKIDLVLAVLRARQIWGGSSHVPGLREALGLDESARDRSGADRVEAQARELVAVLDAGGWSDAAVDKAVSLIDAPSVIEPVEMDELDHRIEEVRRVLEFAVAEVAPRMDRTTDEIDHVVHALRGGFVPAGPSGSPLRGLVNVLPTGRNFYSVDPKAIPSQLAWETGQLLADSLLERHKDETGAYPKSVGLSMWGTSAMRTAGDDIAECLALLGIRPVWDEASRRVTHLEPISLEELGRPRVDVTMRISGFFRDAFPHVVALLDDAVKMAAELEESPEDNYVRAHVAEDGSTTRIFGSRPGTYGAGLLQLIDSKDWRTDADLAEVYTVWGGYAYGRGVHGEPAREAMESAYRRIAVAAKNTDTREHDIADSDDYFQYHGGMVATVRALTGEQPAAYIGDSTRPETVRTRTLVEETSRVFRARVVNPRWIEAMRRHGYKGAFEMAATVDYLFGYDATTGVVADWMYEKLTESYVLDEENRAFLEEANPWALHGMAERLLEARSRGLWEAPPPEMVQALTEVLLEAEGSIEERS